MQHPRIEATDREARHDRWMKLAVIASITSAVCCAAMLTVTISVLRRAPEAVGAKARRGVQEAPAGTRQLLSDSESSSGPSRFAALGARMRQGTPDDEAPSEFAGGAAPKSIGTRLDIDGAASQGVKDLADKLHLSPFALAPLAGEDGEVPTAVVARLERTSDASKSLAKRLGLDESKTQVCSDLFLSQTIGVLNLEQRSDGEVDPEQLDALLQDTLAGMRALAGEGALAEAEAALGELR